MSASVRHYTVVRYLIERVAWVHDSVVVMSERGTSVRPFRRKALECVLSGDDEIADTMWRAYRRARENGVDQREYVLSRVVVDQDGAELERREIDRMGGGGS